MNLKTSWMNVDETEDPFRFVWLMDRVRGVQDNASQYQVVRKLLGISPGQHVLDVGCGTGAAARVFGDLVGETGRVIGLDRSRIMIREAKKRTSNPDLPVSFRHGDAHHLPFPDNFFDSCYSLRVFEIIEDPIQALKEIFRVTRPGGRIFVNGPDVDGWTFDVPNRDVTRKLLHYVCDHEVNGSIGRELPRMFAEVGGTKIRVVAYTAFVEDFTVIHDLFLKEILERVAIASIIPSRATRQWTRDVKERCEAGPFACSQRIFRVAGVKA